MGLAAKHLCQTNICHFGGEVLGQQNVWGLEVQMQNAVAMQVGQASCDVQCNAAAPTSSGLAESECFAMTLYIRLLPDSLKEAQDAGGRSCFDEDQIELQ